MGKADHIIVLMLENRSFDHLLSDLPAAGVTEAAVAPPSAKNPDPFTAPVYSVENNLRYIPEYMGKSRYKSHNFQQILTL